MMRQQGSVVSDREIMLYGTRFPINGGVRHTMVTPFPPKITFGDYTRDDQTVLSTWLLTKFSGGLGIEFGDMPRHQDRYRFGDLETRYRYTTLGPRIYQASTDGAEARLIIEYGGSVYVVTDTHFYKWSSAGLTVIDTVPVACGVPNSFAVIRGILYIQCADGVLTYDGANLIARSGVEPTTQEDIKGVACVVWDDKLFRLKSDGQFFYRLMTNVPHEGASSEMHLGWTACGRLHLPDGYCKQLIVYFDLSGDLVIHAITKVGVFAYDFGARRFYPTALSYPYTESAGDGAIMWRGELYVPVSGSIYKYNGSVIQNVSPAKDDGLPPELQGDITHLVEGHAFYFSIVAARPPITEFVTAGVDDVRFSGFLDRDVMAAQGATRGAILASPGSAWHTITYEDAGTNVNAAAVATTEEGYRLWFSTTQGLFFTDLSSELHNPLNSPVHEYKPDGFLESVWTDTGWAEIDKTAFFVDVEAAQCSDTETITLSVAWDNDPNYEVLGTINTNGRTVFTLGGDGGKVFRSIRFKIEMARGDNPRLTPVIRSVALNFIRRPEPVWGYEVDLQLTDPHNGMTAMEMIDDLVDRIAPDKQAGWLVFNDSHSNDKYEGRVVITRLAGGGPAGLKRLGRYTLSLLEVKEPT